MFPMPSLISLPKPRQHLEALPSLVCYNKMIFGKCNGFKGTYGCNSCAFHVRIVYNRFYVQQNVNLLAKTIQNTG